MIAGDPSVVDPLITLLLALQTGLLRLMHALGLTGDVAGQPAWPFAHRIAIETLMLDRGLARQAAWALAAAVLTVALLLIGIAWRRWRRALWATAVLTAAMTTVVAPWPAAGLLWADAVPTSFHHSPGRFDAASIERGLAVYGQHCASCHGADGRGETPLAAALAKWPPLLSGGLLWKRAEGETFWRIRHGMPAMPGFAGSVSEADTWSLLEGLKALAAGQSMRADRAWGWPVRAPDVEVRCDGGAARALSEWRGQRVRIVAAGAAPLPREDARLVTIVLRDDGDANARPDAAADDSAACAIGSPTAWRALAQVAGLDPAALPGTQFIVDRDGWLRALGAAGRNEWTEDDLLCRSPAAAQSATSRVGDIDGLGRLIRQMDADPVRLSALGLPHAR